MIGSISDEARDFMDLPWSRIEPDYQALLDRPLSTENVAAWLSDWTRLIDLILERFNRLGTAVNLDTTDPRAEARYMAFLDEIYPKAQAADQKLKERLLASGLRPEGFEVPLRKMQAEADIFREANLPLLSQERKLASRFDKIIGAQTVEWDGKELTLQQLRPVYQTEDRSVRERAWKQAAARQLEDREAINVLWKEFIALRLQLAANAGLPGYRDYRWKQMTRLDYTPEDCLQFQEAIEQVVVPAATRMYERNRGRLGVERLRPWDLDLDLYPIHLPPLPSYGDSENLKATAESIFRRVDSKVGEYFHTMRSEGFLDLDNHRGKAPGAYCRTFPATGRPFIFMNAVGLSGDLRTILHESGHAFHAFEAMKLPYAQQRHPGLEFSEVASMGMELLASPYIAADGGGFYSEAQAAEFRVTHLEHLLAFWPYMAVVDAFQHWVYLHPDGAADPDQCDAHWLALWDRYMPGVDWSGLEAEAMTGWHRKLHIHRYPFYYVEYGVAQLGAVQVWRNALKDQSGAVASYLGALAKGGTATLPELYQAAGGKFAFDAGTLGEAVALVESTIQKLEESTR